MRQGGALLIRSAVDDCQRLGAPRVRLRAELDNSYMSTIHSVAFMFGDAFALVGHDRDMMCAL